MKKLIAFTFLFIIYFCSYSQEIRPATTKKQQVKSLYDKKSHTFNFPGYLIKTKPGTFRMRTYSNDCLQLTFIAGHRVQLRIYSYYDISENKISNAVSFRYFLK